jgi:hypothetical protein
MSDQNRLLRRVAAMLALGVMLTLAPNNAAAQKIPSMEEMGRAPKAEQTSATTTHGDQVTSGAPITIQFRMFQKKLIDLKSPKFSPQIQALDGKTVRIIGFMSPYTDLTDLRNFMLLTQPVHCYFCSYPTPLEVIFVRQKEGKKAVYFSETAEVTGKFSLWKPDTKDKAHQMFLFVINDATVSSYKVERKPEDDYGMITVD